MKHPWAVVAGLAVVLPAIPAGTSCSVDPRAATTTTVEAETANDWDLFSLADTNGDGMADALWFSRSARQLEVWLMAGTHVLERGAPIPSPPGEGWEPVISVDFNLDGLSDLVWTNAARGTMTVWLMNGTHVLASGPEIAGPPGEGWVVGTAGDVNGDGIADVVWSNAARRRISVWLMSGTHVLARGPELSSPGHGSHLLRDLGDVNGDGLADIVWTEPDKNRMEVWLMAGTHPFELGGHVPAPPGKGWTAVNVTDFNRDGLEDVIWTNAARGTMAVWLLRGTQLLASGPEIGGPPGEGWSVAAANDVNGDGMADAAWQKEGTSLFSIWLMNGTHVLAPGPILPGPGEIAAGP